MENRFDQYWRGLRSPKALRRAFLVSLVIHTAAALALMKTLQASPTKAVPIAYEVQLVARTVSPEPPTPQPEPPKPEPKVEAPKPEPPKQEPPKPEPPKPEPVKTAKVEKKEEPKPKEPPKPKPEPPKQAAKPPEPKPKPPEPQQVAKAEPKKTGVTMQQRLPTALDYWGRLIQRKVEKTWVVPGGIRLAAEENEAWVSFWVDGNGRLIGQPEIVKHAGDASLGESGVRAILAAAPFPPLPEDFKGLEQQVVYVFSLVN